MDEKFSAIQGRIPFYNGTAFHGIDAVVRSANLFQRDLRTTGRLPSNKQRCCDEGRVERSYRARPHCLKGPSNMIGYPLNGLAMDPVLPA
jgi:hypothetical protein